jgi:hypothetical protein
MGEYDGIGLIFFRFENCLGGIGGTIVDQDDFTVPQQWSECGIKLPVRSFSSL